MLKILKQSNSKLFRSIVSSTITRHPCFLNVRALTGLNILLWEVQLLARRRLTKCEPGKNVHTGISFG